MILRCLVVGIVLSATFLARTVTEANTVSFKTSMNKRHHLTHPISASPHTHHGDIRGDAKEESNPDEPESTEIDGGEDTDEESGNDDTQAPEETEEELHEDRHNHEPEHDPTSGVSADGISFSLPNSY